MKCAATHNSCISVVFQEKNKFNIKKFPTIYLASWHSSSEKLTPKTASTMKLALVLLLMLPLAMSLPKTEHRRFLENIFDMDQLRQIVSSIAHQITGDETEAACEAACHSILLSEDQILHTGCDFICQSFQELMILLDIEDVTTAAP